MRAKGLTLTFAAAVLCLSALGQPLAVDSNVIACRVLESHASAAPPVIVVVFHQQNREDQARFSALLQQNSGKVVSVQVNGGLWKKASVIRLKSCFGRGLLILSPGAPPLNDGATFLLRFSDRT